MFSHEGRSKLFMTALVMGIIALLAISIISGFIPFVKISYQKELVTMDAPLQVAIENGESLEQILQRIENDPKLLRVVDPIFGSTMDRALVNDRTDIVELLLKNGWALRGINQLMSSLNHRNATPLSLAVLNGSIDMARLLIRYGADPNEAALRERNAWDLCKDIISDPEKQQAMMEVLRGNAEEPATVVPPE